MCSTPGDVFYNDACVSCSGVTDNTDALCDTACANEIICACPGILPNDPLCDNICAGEDEC